MFYKNTAEVVSMQKLSAKTELASSLPAGGAALIASLGPAGSSQAELDATIFPGRSVT